MLKPIKQPRTAKAQVQTVDVPLVEVPCAELELRLLADIECRLAEELGVAPTDVRAELRRRVQADALVETPLVTQYLSVLSSILDGDA